jgi:uncharacterized protein (DUF433 family)
MDISCYRSEWGYEQMSIEIAPDIVVDPKVRHGKPIIKGTRVPVELLIGKLAGGMTAAEVAEEYGIADADVRAALAYAAEVLASEEVQATA